MKKRIIALAAVVIISAALSGCTENSETESGQSETAETTSAQITETAETDESRTEKLTEADETETEAADSTGPAYGRKYTPGRTGSSCRSKTGV